MLRLLFAPALLLLPLHAQAAPSIPNDCWSGVMAPDKAPHGQSRLSKPRSHRSPRFNCSPRSGADQSRPALDHCDGSTAGTGAGRTSRRRTAQRPAAQPQRRGYAAADDGRRYRRPCPTAEFDPRPGSRPSDDRGRGGRCGGAHERISRPVMQPRAARPWPSGARGCSSSPARWFW